MNDNFIIFSLYDNEQLANALASQLEIKVGSAEIREFPDGESYVRIDSGVTNKTILLVCRLDHPNDKILLLMFLAQTLKESGASKICLISPYLPYMRQDKRFKAGEAITSHLFASYLSGWIDYLITIDPHLHRIKNLSEIYSIDSTSVLHSCTKIAAWINKNVNSPFIIGPDEESRQWVSEVADLVKAPYAIIKKERYGDRSVKITVPEINDNSKTLVLVDDIISTGSSMLAALKEFTLKGFKNSICIGVHALFNDETQNRLNQAGAQQVISTNTVLHPSNKIDIIDLVTDEIKRMDNNR